LNRLAGVAGKDIVCFATTLFGPVEEIGPFVLIGRSRDTNVVTRLERTGKPSAEEAMPSVQSDPRIVTRLEEQGAENVFVHLGFHHLNTQAIGDPDRLDGKAFCRSRP